MVYDVTNVASFDNLDEWLHIVNKVFAATKKPHLALVGNKGLWNVDIISGLAFTAFSFTCWGYFAVAAICHKSWRVQAWGHLSPSFNPPL